jgi:Plasmid pRiA4b ORF-3-like protein
MWSHVTLQQIEPPIWRRLLLPPSLNLAELHHVLQAAFGWRDEHLHEFIIGGLVYGAPELADEMAAEDDRRTFGATDVHLRDFDLYHVPDPQFLYHYDFGDSWLHLVQFEQPIARDSGHKYPACIAGGRVPRGLERSHSRRPRGHAPMGRPQLSSRRVRSAGHRQGRQNRLSPRPRRLRLPSPMIRLNRPPQSSPTGHDNCRCTSRAVSAAGGRSMAKILRASGRRAN